jgi:cellulose synthase/poly-beta-1,6-N-acetylglucosamine synthase-like glycosyltransferase
MDFLLISWFVVAAVFVGVPGFYFIYMKKQSTKPWKLITDKNYCPSIAILVPVHNEEKAIRLKLENLSKIEYPSEKIETVIVNDASEDRTMEEISRYMADHTLKIHTLDSKERLGKISCLNQGLRGVNADIVIISDADCFWPSDILQKALPYLSDPSVGAVTGRESILNPLDSWVTLGEQLYDNTVQKIRIGESKVHSTLFFQGGFAAYKRCLITEFNRATDDSGTALDVVQEKKRAILIGEIGFYTTFPATWKNKVDLKIRRARQLQHLWFKCLNLLVHGKLAVPKKIAIPEIFMHILSPLFLVVLSGLSVYAIIQSPLFLLAFILVICPASLVRKSRMMLVEAIQGNFILLMALLSFITNKGFKPWSSAQESRLVIREEVLKAKHLI